MVAEDERPGSYQFVHELVRQTLLDELTATRRMRLHRRIAEALEAQPDADERAGTLAHHFGESALDGCAEKAADYALAAAEDAHERAAPEEALRHATRALRGPRPLRRRGPRAARRPAPRGSGVPAASTPPRGRRSSRRPSSHEPPATAAGSPRPPSASAASRSSGRRIRRRTPSSSRPWTRPRRGSCGAARWHPSPCTGIGPVPGRAPTSPKPPSERHASWATPARSSPRCGRGSSC